MSSEDKPIVEVSWNYLFTSIVSMAYLINKKSQEMQASPHIFGVPMNGTIIASLLCKRMEVAMLQSPTEVSEPWIQDILSDRFQKLLDAPNRKLKKDMLVVVDDIAHTGETIKQVRGMIDDFAETGDFMWDHIMYLTMYKRPECTEEGITALINLSDDAPWLTFPWESWEDKK